MKPETETRIIRVLQTGIALMLLGIVLNVPHWNGRGGVRDQFVEGWRQAQLDDHDRAPVTVPDEAQDGGDQ